MSDFLLELSQNPNARNVIKTLGLPIPLPASLRRADGPWEERPLFDAHVAVGMASDTTLARAIASALARAGANPHVALGDTTPFAEPGEAYGRPARPLDAQALPEGLKLDALLFDATAIADAGGLHALYDFFGPLLARLRPSGRCVVIGRPPSSRDSVEAAAAQAALEGFVRSLGKEIGKRGATATLLTVEGGAEDRIEGPLRFLLSARSAFVTSQPLVVTSTAKAKAANGTHWTRPLDGKVVLVTGAARGIGEATARRFSEEGAHVVCLDRPADDGLVSAVARSIGGSVLLADIADPTAPAQIAEHLRDKHGGVDVVVHNAGVTRDKTLARMKPEHWDQAIEINLGAVLRINRALLDAGLLREGGRLVHLSSVAGIAGNLGQTNYAASKAGIIGLVERLAPEVASRGVTVNAIAPGFIETRLTAAIPVVIREAGRRLSALGQGGLPVDVAEAIVFLASPGALGVTGQVLRVCGGALIGR